MCVTYLMETVRIIEERKPVVLSYKIHKMCVSELETSAGDALYNGKETSFRGPLLSSRYCYEYGRSYGVLWP